jgi:alpha-tubulin suppressor-like RCC1 family protein
MTTKILGTQITAGTIETTQLSNTATATLVKTLAPKVLYANVASNTFTVLDDTAVNVGGGYIVVTGAEFQSGATVLIDTTPASAVTYVNSTTLQVQVPTKSAASYNLYVVNPDGGVGIKVSGITYSSEPSWVTSSPLSNQAANTAFAVTLSATGATSYSVAAGSTLPAGTTLAANGYFSGTVSIGAQTTYTFSVVATDAENQDSSKTFQVTVTIQGIDTPGFLYTWGAVGTAGSQPTGVINGQATTPQKNGSETWSKISAGSGSSKGIKTDGTLWTWGKNVLGESGGANAVDSPIQIGSANNWSLVDGRGYSAAAIKTDGTLWTWGYNNRGQLGLNGTSNQNFPQQVGTNTNWQSVTFTGLDLEAAFAIKTDGTLWAWGDNEYGILGLNDKVYRSSPVQVGTNTNWSKLAIGTIGAIKTDGTLWLWGRGHYGRLGIGDSIYRSSPVQVGADTNWSMVVGTRYAAMAAIKTNGTLWTWGRQTRGVSGRVSAGLSGETNSPTQVGSATDWSRISAGQQNFMMAIKTNGTLWLWGDNQYYQLGTGDGGLNVANRSSPTQIGSATKWTTVSAGRFHSLAISNI